MIKIKQNKGITLIALVITIIVILILAGVTIGTLTGENGLFNYAEKSAIETKRAQVEEILRLAYTEVVADSYTGVGDTNFSRVISKANANLSGTGLLIEQENSGTTTVNGIILYDEEQNEITNSTTLEISSESTELEITVVLDTNTEPGTKYYAKINDKYYLIDTNNLKVSSDGIENIVPSINTISSITTSFSTNNVVNTTINEDVISITKHEDAVSDSTILTVTATVNGTNYTKTCNIEITEEEEVPELRVGTAVCLLTQEDFEHFNQYQSATSFDAVGAAKDAGFNDVNVQCWSNFLMSNDEYLTGTDYAFFEAMFMILKDEISDDVAKNSFEKTTEYLTDEDRYKLYDDILEETGISTYLSVAYTLEQSGRGIHCFVNCDSDGYPVFYYSIDH